MKIKAGFAGAVMGIGLMLPFSPPATAQPGDIHLFPRDTGFLLRRFAYTDDDRCIVRFGAKFRELGTAADRQGVEHTALLTIQGFANQTHCSGERSDIVVVPTADLRKWDDEHEVEASRRAEIRAYHNRLRDMAQ